MNFFWYNNINKDDRNRQPIQTVAYDKIGQPKCEAVFGLGKLNILMQLFLQNRVGLNKVIFESN